ncbi:MAG: SAM-dependent methyltransferase, partial [Cryomorphaceae bacterium]|nr:SAM-dependent methyltransferase [Cryomorphaceae bacterium]
IVCDINDFNPKKKYALWHDRAVFHFLTSDIDINRYVENVKLYAENFIIGSFSTSGPKKCSGLDITQYDKSLLSKLFEEFMAFKKVEHINHITPFETTQNFIFCSFSSR